MADEHKCDACDGADVLDFIERNVAKHGRAVLNVFAGAGSPDPVNDTFSYTVGNDIAGMPELLLVGTHQCGSVLNELSAIMLERGRPFEHMEAVSLGGKFPIRVVDVTDDAKDRYTLQATCYLGTLGYRLMQVVLCDPSGRFPWELGCAAPYSAVVIRGRLHA